MLFLNNISTGCVIRIFNLRFDPLEITNLVQGNRCQVIFRNFELSLIEKILNKDLLLTFCNERIQSDNNNSDNRSKSHYHNDYYYDNNYVNNKKNDSSLYSNINTNTTNKETAVQVQACVRYHYENMVNKIHTMMNKLSVFVTYGNIPYEKYIVEADQVLKSTSSSTSSSVVHDNKKDNKNNNENEKGKETKNETERGRERGGGTEVGAGNGTIIVTCNTPIATDLKSLQFFYSEGT